ICNIIRNSGIINFKNGKLQKTILKDIDHNLINLSNKKRYYTVRLIFSLVVYDLQLDRIVSEMYNQPALNPRIGVGIVDSKNQIIFEKDDLFSKYDFINLDISYFGVYGTKFRFTPDNKYLYCYGGLSWKIDTQTGKILEL